MGDLDGKVAVVTGAAGLIGGASARLFGAEGARVVAADVNDEAGEQTAADIRSGGGEAIYRHCDVTSTAQVDALIQCAIDEYGRVDVLHTNPFWTLRNGVADVTDEEWHRTLDVTLNGVFYCSRAVVPHMIRQGGGSIIHTSSVAGLVSLDVATAYCVAKAGVIGLVRAIARDYGRQGIRCNALCPGDVVSKERLAAQQVVPGDIYDRQIMMGRSGSGEEIAAASLFLASDRSSCVTATPLAVDGGWTAL